MSRLDGLRVGFVGGGAMAEALAGGLIAAGVSKDRIAAADPDPARRQHLAEQLGIQTHADNADAVADRDVVVIAVKPGLVAQALAGVDARIERGPLWISIAAGVPLARLGASLAAGARIVRAMPNTPALVGAAATAICGNDLASRDDLALATALFESVGTCWTAPAESLLDAVTGVSGSGPAYVFVFLEALADAGVQVGLPRDAASRLAAQTVLGAARLVSETGRAPAELKARVTSPGGTTIAGLEKLEAGGLRAAVQAAVTAATARTRELAQDS